MHEKQNSRIQKLRSEQHAYFIFFDQKIYFPINKKTKVFVAQKLLKVTISQKLRIAQKESLMHKMSARLIAIYPENFATYDESCIFLVNIVISEESGGGRLHIGNWDRSKNP